MGLWLCWPEKLDKKEKRCLAGISRFFRSGENIFEVPLYLADPSELDGEEPPCFQLAHYRVGPGLPLVDYAQDVSE